MRAASRTTSNSHASCRGRHEAIRYRALREGIETSGQLSAESAPAARLLLRRARLDIIELRIECETNRLPPWTMPLLEGHLRAKRRTQRSEMFFGLAMLLESGLPIREALDTLSQGASGPRGSRSVLRALSERVSEGEPFDRALAAQPTWFDRIEVAVCASAHRTGSLAESLQRLGERAQRAGEVNAKITAALAYPALILAVTIAVVVLLSAVTIPPIAGILTDAGIRVPTLTRLIVAAGNMITGGWIMLVMIPIAIGIAAATLLRSAPRLARLDRLAASSLPLTVRESRVAAFARGSADLVDSGIPFVEAIRLASNSARGPGSGLFRLAITAAAAALESGKPFARAFADAEHFPAELQRMLAIGQESGDLGPSLRRLAERFELRSRRSVQRLTAFLEPAAILAMSAIVGTVVLGAVLPLIRLQELIR